MERTGSRRDLVLASHTSGTCLIVLRCALSFELFTSVLTRQLANVRPYLQFCTLPRTSAEHKTTPEPNQASRDGRAHHDRCAAAKQAAVHLGLYPIVTVYSIAQPLYTRFPIMFSSFFSKVTIGFTPTSAATSGAAACAVDSAPSASSCATSCACREGRQSHPASPPLCFLFVQGTSIHGRRSEC
jgi:hypothetical protein